MPTLPRLFWLAFGFLLGVGFAWRLPPSAPTIAIVLVTVLLALWLLWTVRESWRVYQKIKTKDWS